MNTHHDRDNHFTFHHHHPQQQTDPTGGLSNFSLLLISLNGLTIIFIVLIIICHRSPQEDSILRRRHDQELQQEHVAYEQALQDADVSLLNRAQRRARAKLLMKKSRRLDAAADAVDNHHGNDGHVHAEEDEHEDDARGNLVPVMDGGDDHRNNHVVQGQVQQQRGHVVSRKERQRMAKDIERVERAAHAQQIRIHQMEREEMEREQRKRWQMEKTEKMERERLELMEKEYRQQTYMFPQTNLDCKIGRVQDFLQELERNPVISLEETAEKFHVTREDLVRRLQELEGDGRIPHGILNLERGEYMYIGEKTMKHISNFITDRGAVTLSDVKEELLRQLDALNTTSDKSPHDHFLGLNEKKNQ